MNMRDDSIVTSELNAIFNVLVENVVWLLEKILLEINLHRRRYSSASPEFGVGPNFWTSRRVSLLRLARGGGYLCRKSGTKISAIPHIKSAYLTPLSFLP